MKKTILIFHFSMNAAGSETALLSYLKVIDYSKYEVILMLLDKSGILLEQVPNEVLIKEIKFKNKFFQYAYKPKNGKITFLQFITKLIRNLLNILIGQEKMDNYVLKNVEYVKSADIVIDFAGYGSILTKIASNYELSSIKGTWIHAEEMDWIKNVTGHLYKFNKIFCVSKSCCQKIQELCPNIKDKCEVLYNIVDYKKILEQSNEIINDEFFSTKNSYKILTIARLTEQKGVDIAIKAAKLLADKNLNFKWYIMGKGPDYKLLKKEVDKLGLENNFIFMGIRNNPYPYLKGTDLYVQPSRFEGLSVAVTEAKLLKCKIIVSDIPSMKEIIQNNIDGYVIRLEPVELANIIEEVILEKRKLPKQEFRQIDENTLIYFNKFLEGKL